MSLRRLKVLLGTLNMTPGFHVIRVINFRDIVGQSLSYTAAFSSSHPIPP
jgi:hypothetical protein